eukprot:TRINITY_DN64452_c0_g1_i1.p1 TRINITY_DN64452_c0_g1~~TRINITY_DN64452_c0_g1_i1.p1  ORF type:complete len:140 (-),score=15.22 TRINITY_DN64452_c0_g1_i1:114-533(-)
MATSLQRRISSVKQVLSVGQCGFDNSAIGRVLGQNFQVTVTTASTVAAATEHLKKVQVDLILVNRQFDADGSEGLDFIRQLKATPELASIPVMLVTNYREYAEQAEAIGAVPGFGKSELASAALVTKLQPYLEPDAEAQ